MTETICLVQTADRDEWYFRYWWYHYKKHWNLGSVIDTVFLTENKIIDYPGVLNAQTGDGPFGQQMRRYLLKMCPAKYIFFMHADYFLEEPPFSSFVESCIAAAKEHGMVLLKCCGWWAGCPDWDRPDSFADTGWKMPGLPEEPIWLYNQHLPYLVSHQLALWDREFLASTFLTQDNPWEHEIYGTVRLRERGIPIYAYRGKCPMPYGETVVHGAIRPGQERFFDEPDKENGWTR